MVATRTVRTLTENLFIDAANELERFSSPRAAGKWLARGPITSKQLPHRRLLIVGVPEGVFDPDGMQSGKGPMTDAWGMACLLVCTDIKDPQTAKQECEDALNDLADMLARDGRLGTADGPRDLRITTVDGPYFGHDKQAVPTAWINFDVQCEADIRRNP